MFSFSDLLLSLKNIYLPSLDYYWKQISFDIEPFYLNYFIIFILLSLVVYGLEVMFPWRKTQHKIRKGFWLDSFYLIFNFSLFPILILSPLSKILLSTLHYLEINSLNFSVFNLQHLPEFWKIVIFFVALDFIQWCVHYLLHHIPLLWKFHQIHHSVEEMGFAAHFRFHWMEHIFYTPMKYTIVVILGGFEPKYIFIVHYLSIFIGHLNHANIYLSYGPLKYILNNPFMHIWHHAKVLPKDKRYGVNFGISLSIWDYIFRTAYIPRSGKDISLGFKDIQKFPNKFLKQLTYPFKNL